MKEDSRIPTDRPVFGLQAMPGRRLSKKRRSYLHGEGSLCDLQSAFLGLVAYLMSEQIGQSVRGIQLTTNKSSRMDENSTLNPRHPGEFLISQAAPGFRQCFPGFKSFRKYRNRLNTPVPRCFIWVNNIYRLVRLDSCVLLVCF